jgi:predicted CXXCH cytochrome family protein
MRLRALVLATSAMALWGLGRFTTSAPATYVGKARCAECHQDEAARYRDSHHDRALQRASNETVAGDFSTHVVEPNELRRQNGVFFVRTEGADGGQQDFEVVATLGVEPVQQYLVDLEGGRRQALRLAWDTERAQWFEVRPPDVREERLRPDDPLHWTQLGQTWNTTCADCHSTAVRKGYDPVTATYATTFAEEDVGCEACHGPGSQHAALPSFLPAALRPNVALTRQSTQKAEVETCATCHARRSQVREGFRPGDELLDFYEPAPVAVDLYRPDGRLKDEVFEFGSFAQSKMYARHVKCSDCHEPHTATLRRTGNALCTHCHDAARFDGEQHHHHSAATTCVACHMGTEVYLGVDRRHDHTFRVPRPLAEAAAQSTSTCAQCHPQGATWAQAAIDGWTTHAPSAHWSTALASARLTNDTATLVRLALDESVPVIARATAIGATSGVPEALSAQLELSAHADPWLRLWALRALPNGAPESFSAVAQGLTDSVRSVRYAALEQAWKQPPAQRVLLDGEAMRRASFEFRETAKLNSDRAAGWLSLSLAARAEGELPQAIAAARAAIKTEPTLSGPRAELAALLDEAGESDEARRVRVAEAALLERDVGRGDTAAALALGLVRVLLGEWPQAEQALARACEAPAAGYEPCLALALAQERRCEAEARSCEQMTATIEQLKRVGPADPRTVELAARHSFNR